VRQLRAADRILLGTLLPLWLFCLGLSVREGIRADQGVFPLIVLSARDADSFPSVWTLSWFGTDAPRGYRVGDRVVRIGDADLRGAGVIDVLDRIHREGVRARVELEREGSRFSVELERRRREWWQPIPFSIACALAMTLILLRRPDWPLARRGFVAGIGTAVGFLLYGFQGISLWMIPAALVLIVPVSIALVIDLAFDMPSPRARRGRRRAAIAAWAVVYGGLHAAALGWSIPFSFREFVAVRMGWVAVASAALLTAMVSCHRRSNALERRQLRWVGLGFGVSLFTTTLAFSLHALALPEAWVRAGFSIMNVCLAAVPLGVLVAVVWYDWLDVDRIISAATTSATIAGVLLATLFSAMPVLASGVGSAIGADPGTAQTLVAVGLAAVLVPGYRLLHPRLDRALFAGHYAFEQGGARLLAEIADADEVDSLFEWIGSRLDALLRPESIAVYRSEGGVFRPVHARAAPAPPALPADGPLFSALAARAAPVAAPRWSEAREAHADPLARAALETLGAALVLPLRSADALAGFVSLGPKRSGDIYTRTELALLTAVAARISERFVERGERALRQEAEASQQALRRFVPGVVADRVVRGQDVPAGEREVTLLFVDLRGYTRMATGMTPPEIFGTVSRYTRRVSEVVASHRGAVIEFHGDGLLAVFGAPDALPHKERAAVEAAREIVAAVESLAPEHGGPPLSVGVGIATGRAFVGSVSGHDREIWTVLGNPTNLAARLQALTREVSASIAVDDRTRAAAESVCAGFERRPAVAIRGRAEPLDVWILRSRDGQA
jgi:adenylate cyclase